MIWNLNLGDITLKLLIIKQLFLGLCIYFIYRKLSGNKENSKIRHVLNMFFTLVLSASAIYIRYKFSYIIGVVFIVFSLSFLYSQSYNTIGQNILLVTISLGINYVIRFVGILIAFIINAIFPIQNDYYNLCIICSIQIIIIYALYNIKRIKYGISFLNNKDNYFDIIILDMSVIASLLSIVFVNMNVMQEISKNIAFMFVLCSISMFLTIKKSIEAYYKQKLLIQDLNETKKELEEKKKEVEELEAENLSFSKKSHSLAHKQKSLDFKINKLLMNSENAEELGLQEKLKNIAGQLQENLKLPKLDKTGITEIDDMLEVMQEECRLNGIDFNLQLNGNIYQMTNNYVTKEELTILLADHIKDAIIAINHTDNINKSIMVRLGKIDDCFGLYIYDSGVEFSKEIFEKLGKEPITSYANEGGTGMGFMNTFDTLKKHNASLIIESIGKPCKDNYTKVIRIRFDNKREVLFV